MVKDFEEEKLFELKKEVEWENKGVWRISFVGISRELDENKDDLENETVLENKLEVERREDDEKECERASGGVNLILIEEGVKNDEGVAAGVAVGVNVGEGVKRAVGDKKEFREAPEKFVLKTISK